LQDNKIEREIFVIKLDVPLADVEGLWPQIAISTRSHSGEKHLLSPSCRPSLYLSLAACISADSTGLISMKFGIGDFYPKFRFG
jgi:hypothetical protein